MQELSKERFDLIYKFKEADRFPLIGSVVYGKQEGKIFVDRAVDPQLAFIMHKSGRGLLCVVEGFVPDYHPLLEYLHSNNDVIQYFHVYDASEKLIEAAEQFERVNVKIRHRARMNRVTKSWSQGDIDTQQFTAKSLKEVELADISIFNLGFVTEFWASFEDFVENGLAWIIFDGQRAVSIFYSVCVVNKNCEGDILTLPEYRGKGLASIAGNLFLKSCDEAGINMDWDVFPDNISSLKIAEKLGYKDYYPYNFLSIYKK